MKKQRYQKTTKGEKNKKKDKNLLFLSSLVIVFLIAIIGISYAFYSLTLKGEKEVSITVGTLAIEFKDNNTIQLDNAYPMTDSRGMVTEPYEFSV